MDSNNRTGSLSWKGEFPLYPADQLKVGYNFILEHKRKPQSGARAKVICAKNRVCIARHKLHSLKTNDNVMVLNVSKCWLNADIYWDCSDLRSYENCCNIRDERFLSLLIVFNIVKGGKKKYKVSCSKGGGIRKKKILAMIEVKIGWNSLADKVKAFGYMLRLWGYEVSSSRGGVEDELCRGAESLIVHTYLS